MAYSQAINRQYKALFIFLLDQSFSMDDPIANSSSRKADALALAINAWLQNMVIACSTSEGFKDYFDIAVIGYGSDDQGNAIIEPALIGPLAGREFVSISEIAGGPARVDEVTAFMQDEETGEMLEMPQQVYRRP